MDKKLILLSIALIFLVVGFSLVLASHEPKYYAGNDDGNNPCSGNEEAGHKSMLLGVRIFNKIFGGRSLNKNRESITYPPRPRRGSCRPVLNPDGSQQICPFGVRMDPLTGACACNEAPPIFSNPRGPSPPGLPNPEI